MPSFAHLAAEDRWALVEAVQRFRIEAPEEGGGGPDPATTPGPRREPVAPVAGPDAAARGARLYAAWGCAACHGAAAEGHAAPAADPEAGPGWRDEADRPIAATADLRHACARRGGASPEALERALRFGVGQVMPSYAALLEAEPGSAAALDAWIRSLDPERSGAAGGR
jgi:mono/diheme cytochrome c family protein